jgi:ubiquinone/menaquinone biosynthesis C-methylase UbiE
MPSLPLKFKPEELEGPPSSLYEGVEYKEFWNGQRKSKQDELEHAIISDLLPISGRRIIDVGCGYGRLAECYISHYQQVIMVDGSISLLRQAFERTAGKAIYIAADAMHLPFPTASFDAALMIRVFHHIQDSSACLSELHRILCKDGRLIFTYANKQSVWRVIRWMIGSNKDSPFTTEPVGVGTRLISHHPKAVHRMLDASGFSGIQYYGSGIMDRLADRTIIGRWTMLNRRLAPFFGRCKIAPWIFCSAITDETKNLIDARGILDLLQCPLCGCRVTDDQEGYLCLSCKRHYPVEDGIIDMRV